MHLSMSSPDWATGRDLLPCTGKNWIPTYILLSLNWKFNIGIIWIPNSNVGIKNFSLCIPKLISQGRGICYDGYNPIQATSNQSQDKKHRGFSKSKLSPQPECICRAEARIHFSVHPLKMLTLSCTCNGSMFAAWPFLPRRWNSGLVSCTSMTIWLAVTYQGQSPQYWLVRHWPDHFQLHLQKDQDTLIAQSAWYSNRTASSL